MFSRKDRITKKEEFDAVFSRGKAIHSPIFVMKILENNLDFSRFGVVVSKKISSKAVERNLIKRRMKSALKENQKSFIGNVDVVLYAKTQIKDKSFKEISGAISGLLRKM